MWSTLARSPKRWPHAPHTSSPPSQDFPDACRLPMTAKEVRDIRVLLGYSQSRMAQSIGVRQISTISDWEQGSVHPSRAMQTALLRALDWQTRQIVRVPGDGTWERGIPRRDAAAQWGRGERVGARP